MALPAILAGQLQTYVEGQPLLVLPVALLFLGALGFGLGSLISKSGHPTIAGVPYPVYVAGGVLAANAMMTAVGESTWPVLGAIKWWRQYEAMLATPLSVTDVLIGHLGIVLIRAFVASSAFVIVATLLGAVPSLWGIVAIFASLLVAMAHSAPIMAFSATQDKDTGFSLLFRLGATPMFLFSGTFFPVEQLPAVLRPVAYATPLYHGVELCRGLLAGHPAPLPDLVHVGYLLLWLVAGFLVARFTFRRRLVV
ncbi:ABC transporter permease [Fodinicola feengrottensis]|uniref:ABC transporter permease n=1 Tax=Fodinicola feengrottensis TaxID=435914 RepID=UPI002440FB19|nr:ABC transporter permease [Fodinicola feengrottensis]